MFECYILFQDQQLQIVEGFRRSYNDSGFICPSVSIFVDILTWIRFSINAHFRHHHIVSTIVDVFVLNRIGEVKDGFTTTNIISSRSYVL